MLKKIGLWIGSVLAGIAVILGIILYGKKESVTKNTKDVGFDFEKTADKKRTEAAERLRALPARSVVEQYGSVCDTIDAGRDRFTARLKRELDTERGSGFD